MRLIQVFIIRKHLECHKDEETFNALNNLPYWVLDELVNLVGVEDIFEGEPLELDY